jgi:uncharacterized membrane protein YkoI
MKSRFSVPLAGSAIISLIGGAALASAQLPTSEHSPAFSGHRFANQAKITLQQAKAVAVKARPGTFTDEELEHERGGTGLRYSFDIRAQNGVIYEVGVDARTGKVLENDREGPNPD